MSEVSTLVENEPSPAAPVITTRAKVVRESFTVLRSDFEPVAPVVVRPQRPSAAPAAQGGGQSNLALSIGGGVLLLGGIFAFLFFGYGSNKGAAPSAAATAAPKGAAVAVVTPVHPASSPKPIAHAGTTPKPSITVPVVYHAVAVAPHVAPTPHKQPVDGAAQRISFQHPEHFPEVSHTTPRERPVVHETAKPIARVEAPKPVVHVAPPVHHTPQVTHEHESAPAPVRHHDDSTDLDPLHPLGN